MHRCGLDDNQESSSQGTGRLVPIVQKTWVRLSEAVFLRIQSEGDVITCMLSMTRRSLTPAESIVETFDDVEAFLAEGDVSEAEATSFEEEEVRDVLAVSWKDRRREIAAAKASRNFTRVRELQQLFRKEVGRSQETHEMSQVWSRRSLGPRLSSPRPRRERRKR